MDPRLSVVIATRNKQENVNYDHISEAFERVDLGLKRTTKVSEKDRVVTAFHEAGHLMVLYLLHPTDDVFKASIIPRGPALGITQTLPKEDRLNLYQPAVLDWIAMLMGGRIAEELEFGMMSSGAKNDI